ncbi:hypothetical protein [Hyphomicrobium sp.]|uniref:hypothetical protein n=1 Tax=Hyphomicrobium sp. TaxID=82 RepID=UPI002C85B726|nr:hypothetical protein [Hyphomicrobium sp.]HRN89739.1 hypothetical protein [Hyphomicrobium sp.]HRQ27173.1 hypothetical protein [Hyphomicrobium sp.]
MSSIQNHITAKDSAYLQSLLNSKDQDEDYLALLRGKLENANLLLDHTVDRRVATIDSRVEISIGGGFTEERLLTRDEKASNPGNALPITTPRGLALVGLKEGDVFPLRKPNGIIEPIKLIKVIYQPEAAKRGEDAGSVVQFQPHWKKSLSTTGADVVSDNDDPGPGAA